MRLFWLEEAKNIGDCVVLNPEEAKRLRNVLRLKISDTFASRDRQGFLYQVCIKTITTKEVVLQVLSKEKPILSGRSIELWQAIPKGNRFETALRMAVELGVSRIVPLVTQFSDVKLKEERDKTSRYHRIAVEAVSQCGSLYFREVSQPLMIEQALALLNQQQLVFFCHQEQMQNQKLNQLLADNNNKEAIIVIVGPEGGFSPVEVALMLSKGLHHLYLGDTILRSETAGIVAIAGIKALEH